MFYTEWDSRYYHTIGQTWDGNNNLTVWSEKINGIDNTFYYHYNDDNLVDRFAYDHGSKLYEYDELDRMGLAKTFHDSRELKRDEYTYNGPTGQVTKHTLTIGTATEYTYTYDDRGNILSVSDGTNKTSYAYDSANQLLRENNQAAGKTWVYTYDAAGNILSKTEYAYTEGTLGTALDTVNYTYGDSSWGDLLTAWDGQTVTYDEIGNPTQFGSRTFTWTHGRQLASLTENGTEWEYSYDANGLRSGKSSGATSYYYLYKGGKLTYQEGEGRQLYFSYDITGAPYAMWYAGVNYYYVTNLQGDVTGILDSNGNRIVTYTYDAWGNILSITGSHANTIGQYNPLRYRGYVYDSETGLYYLQSRYYDPAIGRFLNADAFASTGQGILGNNMFAYCHNNPITYSDPSGFIIILAVGATAEQIAQYERAIAYLKTSETGRRLIETLESTSSKIFISFIDNDDMYYSFTMRTIYFDVNSGLVVRDGSSVQSAALGLAHEMGHAAQHLDGTYACYKNNRPELERLNMELYEIPIATELGEPIRNSYLESKGTMNMNNSTHYITTALYNRPWWFYICVWNWGKPSKYTVHHNLEG